MGQIRTFVAIDVSANVKNSAFKTITKLSSDTVDYNWVEKDNLHITLNFLGDVDESEIPAVCKLVKNTVEDFGTFALSLKGLGCFPNPDKPRVVWIGVDEGREELVSINQRLADALESMRFPRERNDYRPHLTLGRLRRGGRWNPSLTDAVKNGKELYFGGATITQVVVYSSYLDRSGPTYTAMSRIDL